MSDLPPTPPAQQGPSAGRPGRWLKIALAVSLAVNLAIAGLVGGAMFGRSGPDDAPAIRTLGLGPFALALPREGRDEVRRRIEGDLPRLRTERMAVGRGLLDVRRALLADPFDRELAEAALMRSREAAMALQGYGHAALLDTFEEMSLDERTRVAERLARAMRRIAGRDGRD